MIAPPVPKNTFSEGDSDSDWDDDDDFASKRISIKIKPIAQITPSRISASVDELRATVRTWKSMANINLVKPNSRRSQHNSQPVAFAIQECLNTKIYMGSQIESSSQLIGRLKMAVPPKTFYTDKNLDIILSSSLPWDKVELNKDFVFNNENQTDDGFLLPNSGLTLSSTRKLTIDTGAVGAFVGMQSQIKPNAKYYLLPEILKYTIGSHMHGQDTSVTTNMSLFYPHAHWLCDLNVTKVRIDIESCHETLSRFGLTTDDVRNLKIIIHINGGATTCQTKPEASWNPLESKLVWSFANLTELIQLSTVNGISSCLARFNLTDGPSTPGLVEIQFSIIEKTISGTHVTLNNPMDFRLATQKFEVRTGSFSCEPPCL